MRRRRVVVRATSVVAGVLCLSALATLQSTVLETFEAAPDTWLVARDVAGGGAVAATTAPVASGAGAARLTAAAPGDVAQLRTTFTDAAAAHTWNERPGTFRWQRAQVFVPSTTLTALGATGSMTLGGFWPSATPTQGWFLRVRGGGQLSVVGTRDTGAAVEFPIYAALPADRWVTLELGLHSQAGPGVKRAFAVFLDGVAHGWFRQGRMVAETYDRVAVGVLATSVTAPVTVFVDDWGTAGTSATPTGPDARPTGTLIAHDFRASGGANWQIDWTTWASDLRLDPVFGLFSNLDRLQSGINLDRAPNLTSGWAEIEIDWPKGRPLEVRPNGYFGPMVGFRKEINREQNLEVIPIGNGDGTVDLVFEAWDGIGPTILARTPLPVASFGGSAIPEPGDVIRARWAQVTATAIDVRASYYDASAGGWLPDILNGVFDIGAISGVDFNDGFHTMSSVTTDSPFYAIRRYHVGTLDTYPGTAPPPPPPLPTLRVNDATAAEGTATPGSAVFTVSLSAASAVPVTVAYATSPGSALAGSDFVATSGTLTFAPGTTMQLVPVTLVADAIVESTETFALGLSAALNATIADADGVATITDDDTATGPTTATFAIAAGADDVNEVTNTLTATATTLFVGTANGTSHAGFRFTGVTIPRGATVTSARVQVRASSTQWNAKQFEWAAEAAGNAAAFTATSRPSQRVLGTARVTHNTNVQWVSGTWYTLEELAPLVQGVVARSDWNAGNALALVARGTGGSWSRKFLSAFESGAANAPRLVVTFTPPGGGAPDPPPTASVNDVTIAEGTGGTASAVFTVTLSAPATQTVTIGFATANGTATAPADYASTAGTLTFAPGVTTQTITVPLVTDNVVEPNETFTVGLLTPVNATIADGTGQATITNDDAAPPPLPTLAINDVSVTEGTGSTASAVFTVTLSATSTQVVTVGYATANGTATAPADFASTSGTLTFPAGVTTQTIAVPLVTDSVVEPNETFTVGLINAVNATIADGTGQATIANDDVAAGPSTVTLQIAAAGDDVNQEGTAFTAGGSTLWIGNGAASAAAYAGLRFTGATIPRGATITAARLEVQAASTQWLTIGFEMGLEASASAAAFSAAAPPSARTLLAPRVAHTSNTQWMSGTWYAFEDITPLVQALVTRADWSPGNALALILRGTGGAYGRKFARAFEAGAATAPRLVVSFVVP